MKYPRIKNSYKFIFALAILALILLIAVFIIDTKKVVRAQNQIKIFPTAYKTESSGDITWQNPKNAFNQDLPDNASLSDFNPDNSAFISVNVKDETTTTTISSLIFSDFLLPDNFEISQNQNNQLGISLAGKSQEGDKVTISYFYYDQWQNLEELDLAQEISNQTNGNYFFYALPAFENIDDFKNLQIKLQSSSINFQAVYLDAVWLDINYEENASKVPIFQKVKHDWKFNEEPEFEVSLPQTNNLLSRFNNLIGKNNFDSILHTPDNIETKEGIIIEGNKIKVTKPNKNSFRPGLYKLQIRQADQIITQEFTWGVLTINTNKSIYLPNETAYLQMAALNEAGHTLCDAHLKLAIISPRSVISTPTIIQSDTCGPNNVTDIPDYFAYYQVGETGTYQMKLTNLDNNYETLDFFEVRDTVPFEIERIGPTRIYPLAKYEMKLKIKANQDFNGQVREQVPADFIVSNPITWNVNFKTGEEYSFSYIFDAPDISPYIYLLGPLQIGDFQEIRQWQIASDALKVYKMQTGYYIGTASPLAITGLGFKPDLVIVKPQSTAGAGAVFKTNLHPKNNVSVFIGTTDLTDGSIKIDDDGFTVYGGNTDTINVIHEWLAFSGSDCSASGKFCVGTYYGTGSGTSTVSVGFQPDLAIVKQAGSANQGNWRSSSMLDNYAEFFALTTEDTAGNYFTTLDANGFTVGATNNTAANYYFLAFKNTDNKIKVGSYLGTSTAQDITDVGFQPNFVFTRNATSTAVGVVFANTESYGDLSYYFTDVATVLSAITNLISNGFSVGTAAAANADGVQFYYAAFGGAETHTATGTFDMANGSYTGTGNYFTISGLGFQPDLVVIKGDTTQAGIFKTKVLPADYSGYLDSATANIQNAIISLDPDGFKIGSGVTVNTSGTTYYWTAYGNAWDIIDHQGAADFLVGAYLGNAVDSREITRLPVQPDLVTIKRNSTTGGVFRTSEHSNDYSSYFAATAEAANLIQALNADGFEIGTAANVNTSASYYFYFGFATSTNFAVGTYVGNATSTDIDVGFEPDNIWVKRNDTTRGVLRTSSLDPASDGAFPFINIAKITNAITRIFSNGFTVNTAAETNTNGSTYRWLAWKNPVTFTQSAYRFFENSNSTDVGLPLADRDTPAALTSSNSAFRLRLLIHIGISALSQSWQEFKLQFAEKSGGSCGDDETFSDISTSTLIAFNDNSTPIDDSPLTATSTDPVHNSDEIVDQTYEELNNFTNSQAAIPAGQDGKWDFSLIDNSAPASTTYCFQITKSDDRTLDNYTVYPEITTAAASIYSVTVSDGVITYGILDVGTSTSTLSSGLNDLQTATNNGGATENLNIKGATSTCWTLAATIGYNQYVHEFSTSSGSSWTALTTDYQPLATNVIVSATSTFDLRITAPDDTNCFDAQNVNVTVQAVAP